MSPRHTPRPLDGTPRLRRHPWRAFVRAVSWHRRKLAVLAAVAAVLTSLAATAPPAPPTVTVVQARSGLDGGALLQAADLELVALPDSAVPAGAVTETSVLVGRRLAAPVASGQVLTDLAVVSHRSLSGPGRVLAPLRIADADLVAQLRAGDVVDVLAADSQSGKATTVATRARVVTIPQVEHDAVGSGSTGALVLVDVDVGAAETLAQAASNGSLSVIWP